MNVTDVVNEQPQSEGLNLLFKIAGREVIVDLLVCDCVLVVSLLFEQCNQIVEDIHDIMLVFPVLVILVPLRVTLLIFIFQVWDVNVVPLALEIPTTFLIQNFVSKCRTFNKQRRNGKWCSPRFKIIPPYTAITQILVT